MFILLFCLASTRQLRIPRISHKAVNRWFLAVNLLRNPSLIQYRKQKGKGVKTSSVVELENINADLIEAVNEVVSTAQF